MSIVCFPENKTADTAGRKCWYANMNAKQHQTPAWHTQTGGCGVKHGACHTRRQHHQCKRRVLFHYHQETGGNVGKPRGRVHERDMYTNRRLRPVNRRGIRKVLHSPSICRRRLLLQTFFRVVAMSTAVASYVALMFSH